MLIVNVNDRSSVGSSGPCSRATIPSQPDEWSFHKLPSLTNDLIFYDMQPRTDGDIVECDPANERDAC